MNREQAHECCPGCSSNDKCVFLLLWMVTNPHCFVFIFSMVIFCQSEDLKEHQLSLQSACCAALAELCVNDSNAQQIVQDNGIYSIGLLILPPESTISTKVKKAYHTLQVTIHTRETISKWKCC